ncbi:MAG: carboxylating nicotinate-nucleotide diphosphorylase [Syntrophaceae bacterium]|nr:carboxylating nicotinate-nucleotide diphosphorylase [Syntrophaceae bacterium]
MDKSQYSGLIERGLAEDLGWGDVTTDAVLDGNEQGTALAVAKSDLVVAGMDVFQTVFHQVDASVVIKRVKNDGEQAGKGDVLAEITGNLGNILRAERVALNILQRMCGIATRTRSFVEAVQGTRAAIVDTRKTLPGFRVLDKYAVTVGGGRNHRFGLSDGVLIKDNHIDAAGGITEAVKRCRPKIHHLLKIEVECRNFKEVKEALEVGADVLLLDNMSPESLKEAADFVAGRVPLEASGNVNIENVRKVAETGVDLISVGGLTHSVMAADISLIIKQSQSQAGL